MALAYLLPLTTIYAATISVAYEYDALDRIKTATFGNNAPIYYSYDKAGNISSVVANGSNPLADLSITQTDSADPVLVGANFSYNLSVKNAGPNIAQNLKIIDTLPTSVIFKNASGNGWTCKNISNTVTCTLGSLTAGTTANPITINVTAPNTAGILTNSVKVSADTKDSNITNNNSTETTQVNTGAVPGTLQFSLANYNINENAGTAIIVATRTGGTSGAVSVNYATSNGTAKAGSDYTTSSGTLKWTNGDSANKTFTISIIDDNEVETDETVNLTLSNAIGAKLGSQKTATLTIKDNDKCNYNINPTSRVHTASAETGSVTVTTSCQWTATSNVAWVKITSGSKGTGNGIVKYSVDANTGIARTGTLSIAGKTFTINQKAKTVSCIYTINPTSAFYKYTAANGSVGVTASANTCKWTATSNVIWATITSGSKGTGNGTVKYYIQTNIGVARQGTLTIAGKTFTINQAKKTEEPPAATLVSPTGAITDNTPSYTWNAVSNSSWYYLWVNDSTGNKIKKWYTANEAGCSTGTGTCSITPNTSLANGKGTWWIQTWNSKGYGPWSNGMDFTLKGAGGPPTATTLVSPKGSISQRTPTYVWNAVSNSTWYYLWLNQGTTKKFAKWYQASDVGCGDGKGICAIKSSLNLNEGKHTWWIKTWNSKGYGPWSSGMDFTLTGSGGSPIAATLVSPKGTISERTPTYVWNAVSNSTWYYLWLNQGTTKKFAKWYQASDVGCGDGKGICAITSSSNLTDGKHTWWIQTWNSKGYGPWSSPMDFKIQAGTNNATNFISKLNLTTPIKLGKELEVNLIISPNSAHIGKQADLILVLEYWPTTAAKKDRMIFYRDVDGKWQIWTEKGLPPETRTYKELPALIKETISLGVLQMRGKYSWYATYVLTDGTVVSSSSEPLVFVIE